MNETRTPLCVLLIGCGVIGSIYGGQVTSAGHSLCVLAHGEREREVVNHGIHLHDLDKGTNQTAKVQLAQTPNEREYDIVLVTVQAGQLASTFSALRLLKGTPDIIFFGNNPNGHAAIPRDLPGSSELAFPGVGGSLRENIVEYAHVVAQPTTFEAKSSLASKKFQAILEAQGFSVQRTANMDGWLQYHAVLISCIGAALLRAEINATKLGNDRKLLSLMCRAIEEGFQSLKAQNVQGLPQNLKILHNPLLRPIARMYWSNLMRSPKGELFFAAHVRHSVAEVHELAEWTLEHTAGISADVSRLKSLLLAV